MIGLRFRIAPPAALVILVLPGCSQESVDPIRPVRAIQVGDADQIAGRVFPGRAKASIAVDISFRVSGPLIELPIDVGSRVSKGDVLARIDPRDFEVAVRDTEARLATAQSQLRAMQIGAREEEVEQLKAVLQRAEAELKLATAEFDRVSRLLERRAAQQAEYDRAEARREQALAEVRVATENLRIGETGARPEDIEAKQSDIRALQAGLDNARSAVEDAVLRAPFDGEVSVRRVDNFQFVQARQSIARLVNLEAIEVMVDVPESMIHRVEYVTEVWCRFDAFPGLDVPARIKTIGSEASATTRTFPVTLEVHQPEGARILPGMSARAWGRAEHPGISQEYGFTIPESAVFRNSSGGSAVWVVDPDRQTVAAREVHLLGPTSLGVRIAGLEPGTWVVTAGANTLREGQQVRLPKLEEEPGEPS